MDYLKDKVTLDVGGQIFVTTKTTLCSVDGYFACMLQDGVWGESQKDSTAPIFIDRDPTVFSGILSYMRSRKVVFSSTQDTTYLQLLYIEADFYQLTELVKVVQEEIEARKLQVKRRLVEENSTGIYRVVNETEANSYLDRGWTYVSYFQGNETYGCYMVGGTNMQAYWLHNQCSICHETMTSDRFVKHATRFQPCMLVITKKTTGKTVNFSSLMNCGGSVGGGSYKMTDESMEESSGTNSEQNTSGLLEFDQSFG